MGRKLITIIGGARSGKSRLAVELARAHGRQVLFVATAQPSDAEMERRIGAHRRERPMEWKTVEAPTGVGRAIAAAGDGCDTVIVDCITLLVSNLMRHEEMPQEPLEADADAEIDALLEAYRALEATFLVVTNEVGLGIVPAYAAGRVYRDVLGRVNRRLAESADQAVMLVAGIPVDLKRLRAEILF